MNADMGFFVALLFPIFEAESCVPPSPAARAATVAFLSNIRPEKAGLLSLAAISFRLCVLLGGELTLTPQ